jgi:hypothetical protein
MLSPKRMMAVQPQFLILPPSLLRPVVPLDAVLAFCPCGASPASGISSSSIALTHATGTQRHAIEDLEIKELLIQLSTFVKSSPAITPDGGGI